MNALIELVPPHDMNPPRSLRPKRVIEHLILCSLRAIPTSRVQTAFRAFDQVGDREFAASLRQVVPSSRMRDDVILVGRVAHEAVWSAVAFDAKEPDPKARRYVVRNGQFEDPAPFLLPLPDLFLFQKPKPEPKKKPKTHGKARNVPRQIHIHVVDGIESIPSLRSRLELLAERF